MSAVLPAGLAEPRPEAEAESRMSRTPRNRTGVEAAKLGKRLHRQVGQAILDFNMIEPGDKVKIGRAHV